MKKEKRLSQEKWFALTLNIFAKEGKAQVEIDRLANKLGVTKGSFYSHFRDKQHFRHSLAIYWADTTIQLMKEKFVNSKQTGKAKLSTLMRYMKENEIEKYDLVIRTWALDDAFIAEQVERVDLKRFDLVKSIFSEIGFDDAELEMRSMMFLVFHSIGNALVGNFFNENRLKHDELRHRLLTERFKDAAVE